MIRNILAIAVAIVVAFVTIMLVEKLGHIVYPPPEDIDFGEPAEVREFIGSLPVGAILFVGAAWAIGTFVGSISGALIGTNKSYIYSVVVGGLVLAGAITNLIIIPHPIWFTIAAPIAVIAAAFLAAKTAPLRATIARSASGDVDE